MRVISRSQVLQLLPMADCIAALERTLADLARGEGVQPLRQVVWTPDRRGLLGLMPAFAAQPPALGVKLLSIFPQPPGTPRDSHQGGVLLFDPHTGEPLALVDAGAVTGVRTAAVSGIATRRLARGESCRLALLGSGVQARSHLEAMLAVRPIERVRVWSRTRAHAERFADEQSALRGVEVAVAPDVAAAVEGADVICTLTAAREPVLPGSLLRPGMHVNCVGASSPAAREIDTEAVRRATLFTDRRESLAHEAGEFVQALAEEALPAGLDVPEIGEVVAGLRPGRASEKQITLFRSLGLGIEDVAAARLVYERALAQDTGTLVDLAD